MRTIIVLGDKFTMTLIRHKDFGWVKGRERGREEGVVAYCFVT